MELSQQDPEQAAAFHEWQHRRSLRSRLRGVRRVLSSSHVSHSSCQDATCVRMLHRRQCASQSQTMRTPRSARTTASTTAAAQPKAPRSTRLWVGRSHLQHKFLVTSLDLWMQRSVFSYPTPFM
eukprot:865775-Amphidinium_carterae.1